jgi:hypothetical protein
MGVLAWVAWAALFACSVPTSRVARGESYSTGVESYDDFFTAVAEVRTQAKSAPSDESAAHEPFMKAMGVDASGKPSAALDEATSRANKLKAKGVLLHLEIAPEPKVIAARGKGDLGADGEAMVKAVESSVKTLLDARKRLSAIAQRAVDLEKKRADLRDQVDTAFKEATAAKRDEIRDELDASKGVLADAGDGAGKAAGAASRFVVDLVQAVETGAGGGAPVDAGKGARGKKAPAVFAGGGPKGAAPAAAGAAPAPAPVKKKPKGGDDFEP